MIFVYEVKATFMPDRDSQSIYMSVVNTQGSGYTRRVKSTCTGHGSRRDSDCKVHLQGPHPDVLGTVSRFSSTGKVRIIAQNNSRPLYSPLLSYLLLSVYV